MKNLQRIPALVTILLLLMVGSLLIQGCEKPKPPVVPEELKPTLEVSKIPTGVLPYGSDVKISWTTTNATTLKINEISQANAVSGTATFKKVCSEVLYTIKATNIYLSTQREIEVHVGDWTTSTFGLVSYYPWTFKEFRTILIKDGSIVYREEPTTEEKAKRFYYHKNGDLVTNFLTYTGKWLISDDGKYITIGKTTEKFSVSTSELVLYQETTWDGQPAYFLNVFEHASTIPTDK